MILVSDSRTIRQTFLPIWYTFIMNSCIHSCIVLNATLPAVADLGELGAVAAPPPHCMQPQGKQRSQFSDKNALKHQILH